VGASRGLTGPRAGIALAVAGVALLAATARPAAASPAMRVGIFDQAQTMFGQVTTAFSLLGTLHPQVVRINLNWGGPFGVARRRPANPTDPNDPAYSWARYDRAVNLAAKDGIQVLFAVYGTPLWANGRQPMNVAPQFAIDLRNFAYAAATRYSGTFAAKGKTLPAVHDWLAWTEPNNPSYLTPQYRDIAGAWVIESAITYTAICNAVYGGVHATSAAGERVACGGTAPTGNNDPTSTHPSVAPLTFLRAVKASGLASFDAWAHDPFPGSPSETPTTKPVGTPGHPDTSVRFGNIDDLTNLVTKLYGFSPIWVTGYGYETNPPDAVAGVSPAKQAAYLTEAFGIARANPRIQLMLWYLLIDDRKPSGWQSGLIGRAGKKKPSFSAFRRVAEGSG
jgi:hypothetical protein